eukprot:1369317-Rhodomonas_salina.1
MAASYTTVGVLLAIAFVGVCSAVPLQRHSTISAPTVTYGDLVHQGRFTASGASNVLRTAMTTQGFIAVSGIPNFGRLRREALLSSFKCTTHASTARSVELKDGTQRLTIAGVTHGRDRLQEMEFGTDNDACAS